MSSSTPLVPRGVDKRGRGLGEWLAIVLLRGSLSPSSGDIVDILSICVVYSFLSCFLMVIFL